MDYLSDTNKNNNALLCKLLILVAEDQVRCVLQEVRSGFSLTDAINLI